MNATTHLEAAALAPTQSRLFARFALELQLDDVPAGVREFAKEHLLDALGIAIASTGFDFGAVTLDAVRELGEGAQATAVGTGTRLPATSAALLNGVLAHGLDFDDTHIAGIYHASAQALAVCFAAGEAHGATGAEVLTAFIAAIEIGSRMAVAAEGGLNGNGFHPTAVCGTFAALYAAGRIAKVSEDTLVHAAGIAGSMASGGLELGTSWLKRLHPGWSAHAALTALALARAGFTGPPTILEGERGFYANHMRRVPSDDKAPTLALGRHWEALGIALKPYPCCHFIHAFVDAALELRRQIDVSQITRIECLLTPFMHKMVAEPREECIRPSNPYRALFSVQYVTALALLRGRADLAAFHDEPLDAPDVLALAAKTFCLDDALSDYPAHFPGEVVVRLEDGRVLRSRKPASRGTREVPLPRAEVVAKFKANATRVIAPAQAEKLAGRILALEDEGSLRDIIGLAVKG